MARIIDKDTRLIDIDFNQIGVNLGRSAGNDKPTSVTLTQSGQNQVINNLGLVSRGGSFIQYSRIDLSYMTENNEVMQPVNVSVQRTSPVPLGGSNNGNNFDKVEEYIFVLTRPLNNDVISNATTYASLYRPLRNVGLDGTEALAGTATGLAGLGGGWPSQEQTIYAEQRLYSVNLNNAATVANGEIPDPAPGPVTDNTLTGIMNLDLVNSWGSMNSITGPNLHVYRVVIVPSQDFSFVPGICTNELLGGLTSYEFPAVNISFLCKDPNYSEGEYLTRVANAMNSTPEGGPTA